MSNASFVSTAAFAASFSAAGWLSGAAVSNAGEPVFVEDVKTVSATVESVDANNRLMFVRDSDGRSVVITVPQEVRDLTQVKVGDKLSMHYRESVALAVAPKRSHADPNQIDPGEVDRLADTTRTPPEGKSALVSSYRRATNVVIQSIDKATHSVAYKDENGFNRTMEIKDPEIQKIVDTLKEGDQVQMIYTEATVISMDP